MDTNTIISSPRDRASKAAHQAISIISKPSKLPVLEDQVRRISWSNVREQSLLGKGAFSCVYRVEINEPELRNKNCAIKFLSPNITNISDGDFDLAAIDLAMEADILSRLDHENIITLYGVYGGELSSSYTKSRGNFLILEVLEDTLAKRLERCRMKERRMFSNTVPNSKLIERINNIALGVARGMEYLHNNRVVFRDLKPHNIGFNSEGKPVIFDFGFARELHLTQKDEIAGSLRYMSPEMAFGQEPSLPSDVYSFGVLLFEICTLQKPFKQFKDRSDFTEHVLLGDYRPSLSPILSKSIRELISLSWDSEQEVRPDMSTIVKALRVESALADSRVNSDTPRSLRTRSTSFNGQTNLKRRNSLENYKWDSIGKNSSQNAAFFKRASFRVEGNSSVSPANFDGESSLSDMSLGSASATLPKRRCSGSLSMKSLSWSRSSFASIGSIVSESTADSNDSKNVSEFTLGRIRRPFKRPSFINFSPQKAAEVQTNQ